jgi:Cation/multidrug efflux pump
MAFFFVQLKPWEERKTEEAHARGVVTALNKAFAQQIPEGQVLAFGPPAIPGLGTGAGFTMQLQDRSGGPPQYLADQAQRFMVEARKRPEIGRIGSLYRAAVPQVFADIDRSKVLKSGVQLNDVNTTLGALLGSPTSTTSTSSAACTRCTCRPSRSSGETRSNSGSSSSRTRRAAWSRSTR